MQIIVQRTKHEDPIVKREFNTDILTVAQCLDALAPIIDVGNWHKVDDISMWRTMQVRISYNTTETKSRADRLVLLSDGANIIRMLDWTEQSRIVKHDPEILILGPDAQRIYDTFMSGLQDIALSNLLKIQVNKEYAEVLAGMLGMSRNRIGGLARKVSDEAQQALKVGVRELTES